MLSKSNRGGTSVGAGGVARPNATDIPGEGWVTCLGGSRHDLTAGGESWGKTTMRSARGAHYD